jgi:hypothetical protein
MKDISFFVPHTKRSQYEVAYDAMKAAVKYQMGWSVSDRRIESLTYTSNKKKVTARIGEQGQVEHQCEVAAILEGPLYIIVTIKKSGEQGPTVLVSTQDVIELHDFKLRSEQHKASLLPAM